MQQSMSRAGFAEASILLIALTLIALTAGSSVVTAREVTLDPSQSAMFLQAMSTSNEKWLKTLPGMTPDAVTRILAFRNGGKSFASISKVREVSGLSPEQFDRVQGPYSKAEISREDSIGGQAAPAEVKTATPPGAGPGRRGPIGAAKPDQPATPSASPQGAGGSAINLEVKSGYYSILPGYDLEKLVPEKRKIFLDTINREKCSCGCTDDSLGSCLVNDPGCLVVKARVKKVYTDIFGSAPPASAGSGASH